MREKKQFLWKPFVKKLCVYTFMWPTIYNLPEVLIITTSFKTKKIYNWLNKNK